MLAARLAVGSLFACSVIFGCGGGDTDEVQQPLECPAPDPNAAGGACTENTDCDIEGQPASGFCLNESSQTRWPEGGFCVAFSSDPCVLDSDCAAGEACVTFFGSSVCMPACCEDEEGNTACSEGRICAATLLGGTLEGGPACVPGNADARDGDSCSDFGDCAKNSFCRNDPLVNPGGVCRTAACRNDEDCADPEDAACVEVGGVEVTGCFKRCTGDTDCRAAEGYFCDDRLETPVCRHGQPGDRCTEDRQCGNAPWSCLPDPAFPGGYCSVTACDPNVLTGCPFPSFCYDPGGMETPYCSLECEMGAPGDCPTNYECVLTNDSQMGNEKYGCVPAMMSRAE